MKSRFLRCQIKPHVYFLGKALFLSSFWSAVQDRGWGQFWLGFGMGGGTRPSHYPPCPEGGPPIQPQGLGVGLGKEGVWSTKSGWLVCSPAKVRAALEAQNVRWGGELVPCGRAGLWLTPRLAGMWGGD